MIEEIERDYAGLTGDSHSKMCNVVQGSLDELDPRMRTV